MVKHQLEEDDKEIEYLEKKLGLGGSDSKNQKEVRRRLNKELKGDGFGDDIMSFLDQMDHVMDETNMAQIRKELSPEEIAKLEEEIKDTKPSKKEKKTKKEKKENKKKIEKDVSNKNQIVNVKQLEKEAGKIPSNIDEDDGIEDDISDDMVDKN